MRITVLATVLSVACVAGCASYQERQTAQQPNLPAQIPHVVVDPNSISLWKPGPYKFDPTDGLDETEVAILAVVNNPDLRLARDDTGIAKAEAFSAGLLPDPQVSASLERVTNGAPDTNPANSVGLSWDVGWLLTRNVAVQAAKSEKTKTDLNVLWQEWQVVSQARLLFARSYYQQKQTALLSQQHEMLSERYTHMQKAMERGDVALDAVTSDLTALQDNEKQVSDLKRQASQNFHELSALVGLSPDVPLPLVGEPDAPSIDEAAVKAMIPQLLNRRPDLLALEAGSRSQDFRYRQAIIEQFPAVNVGVTKARDTSNVRTLGPNISIGLPLFNRNQGNIAIEKATRQRLDDELAVRLDQAEGTILEILADSKLAKDQLAEARRGEATLQQAAASADAGYKRHDMDELAYITLRTALLNKQIEVLTLEQELVEQRIGLQTLMGSETVSTSTAKGNKP